MAKMFNRYPAFLCMMIITISSTVTESAAEASSYLFLGDSIVVAIDDLESNLLPSLQECMDTAPLHGYAQPGSQNHHHHGLAGGSAFWEGHQFQHGQGRKSALKQEILEVEDENLLWPDGVVHYSIDDQFSEEEEKTIVRAMNVFHCSTRCVRFELWGGESDYLMFVKHNQTSSSDDDDICGSSHVGRIGGDQPILLVEDCIRVDVIVELLTTAIGFTHVTEGSSLSGREAEPKFVEFRMSELPHENSHQHVGPWKSEGSAIPHFEGQASKRGWLSPSEIQKIYGSYRCEELQAITTSTPTPPTTTEEPTETVTETETDPVTTETETEPSTTDSVTQTPASTTGFQTTTTETSTMEATSRTTETNLASTTDSSTGLTTLPPIIDILFQSCRDMQADTGEGTCWITNDPTDCTRFIQCANNIPYFQTCSDSVPGKPLHFDVDKCSCDWPEQARCLTGNQTLGWCWGGCERGQKLPQLLGRDRI